VIKNNLAKIRIQTLETGHGEWLISKQLSLFFLFYFAFLLADYLTIFIEPFSQGYIQKIINIVVTSIILGMKKYLYIFSIYLSSAYRVFWLNPRNSRKIIQELNLVLSVKKISLDANISRRIKLYILMSDFTNSWFCSLRGYAATTKEKHDTFYLAAIMPLLDDLTDSLKTPSIDIIKGLKNNNDSLHPSMPAIRYLYNKLLNNCSDSFVKLFHEALKVQDKSILQLENHTLDTAILKQITYEKGGISTFLFRLVLENSLVKNEEKAIYELGYLIQLINDMFDVYKDHKNKQQTLFTNASSLSHPIKEFSGSFNRITRSFLSLDYHYKDIKKCLSQISTITSRGQVCIEQLLECEISTQGNFLIDTYQRKQLICDMDTFSSIYKTFKYSTAYCEKL
jgi:hypothetical protein